VKTGQLLAANYAEDIPQNQLQRVLRQVLDKNTSTVANLLIANEDKEQHVHYSLTATSNMHHTF